MIWFMEGHGSDGRIMKGRSVYGAAKRALRYAANALAVEAEGEGILIGTRRLDILLTEFTLSRMPRCGRGQRPSSTSLPKPLKRWWHSSCRGALPRTQTAHTSFGKLSRRS